MEITENDIRRFESKYTKKAENDCWEWHAALKQNGYGWFAFWRNGKTINKYAHRFSYEIKNGEIPKGKVVRHRCHNRACVNPAHLQLGTSQDNSNDMKAAGRSKRGLNHKNTKLTDEEVDYIKKNYWSAWFKGPSNCKELAKRFGVHPDSITRIVAGKGRVT